MPVPLIAFRVENCTFVRSNPRIAAMVYGSTHGDPCTTGCHHYKKGGCPSYQRLRRVPLDFDSQVMSLCRNNMGLLTLTLALQEFGATSAGVPIALHLLTTNYPLQIQDPSDLWDALKRLYPHQGGIDCETLAADINKKLKEIGLLE